MWWMLLGALCGWTFQCAPGPYYFVRLSGVLPDDDITPDPPREKSSHLRGVTN